MSYKNPKLKNSNRLWVCFSLIAFSIMGFVVSKAFAQYSGGNQTSNEETTIGSNIYSGGSQNNSPFGSTSGNGTLSHGTATKLVFTVTPSADKHNYPFKRQPVVAVHFRNNYNYSC